MTRKTRNILIGILAAIVVIVCFILLNHENLNYREKYEGEDLSYEVAGIGRTDTYAGYLDAHADSVPVTEGAAVDLTAFSGNAEMIDGALLCDEGSEITWKVNVPETGFYNILVEYMGASPELNVVSRGVDMERRFAINGEIPFSNATSLSFSRLWKDAGEVRKDNRGNDIRPSQVETYDWQTAYFRDDTGYVTGPFSFWFEKGENEITLTAVNEPWLLRSIELVAPQAYPDYQTYLASVPQVNMSSEAMKYSVTVQGEDSTVRSAPSLFARYDRSSPDTKPYSVTTTILNYIGGEAWSGAGEWIEWEFEVPEDGYYNITVKARQMYNRGAMSCRTLYIDGKVPFDAMASIAFKYSTNWEIRTLSDEKGTPYRFYLEKGKHTIRMEVTMGDMGQILSDIENSVYRLNQMYRKILVLTGAEPDSYRDYGIKDIYPEVLQAMSLESKRLYKVVDDMVTVTGQKNDRAATAQSLAILLESFAAKPNRITRLFGTFKDDITALGSVLQDMTASKLDVDLIIVSGEKAALPKVHEGFFARLAHEVRSLFASYTVDYNAVGNTYEGDDDNTITVWICSGRDQSTILKNLVDETFTEKTGIKVNVRLVSAGAILTAVVAGNGPDVVLTASGTMAVDYAMRNAVVDLTQFADFDTVASDFYESALTPLRYMGGVYGLPETETFSLLFYRTDVLADLGLEVPQTWDDLIAALPTIQGNNMTVGIPYSDTSSFCSMLFQRGGSVYDENNMRTLIDEENGIAAFKTYTSLYVDYGLPVSFDFVTRFRSGEMPIGIVDYGNYNTLAVSAPEIRGLWDFTFYPGTLQPDGSIDRTCQSNSTCCIMIEPHDDKVRNNAWEFMKWWVSTDTQVEFGKEIESILGSSARYATANKNALRKLAWSSAQLAILEKQMSETRGFPNVAGGYSTTRHIINAIRRVINTQEDARETLVTYARTINEEVTIKRQEFNLPTY